MGKYAVLGTVLAIVVVGALGVDDVRNALSRQQSFLSMSNVPINLWTASQDIDQLEHESRPSASLYDRATESVQLAQVALRSALPIYEHYGISDAADVNNILSWLNISLPPTYSPESAPIVYLEKVHGELAKFALIKNPGAGQYQRLFSDLVQVYDEQKVHAEFLSQNWRNGTRHWSRRKG